MIIVVNINATILIDSINITCLWPVAYCLFPISRYVEVRYGTVCTDRTVELLEYVHIVRYVRT